MKKWIAILLAAILVVLACTGCAPQAKPSEEAKPNDVQTSDVQTDTDEIIEITMINCFPEAATDTAAIAFHKVFKGFSEKYPNIKINLETVDPSTYPFKMQTLAMGDEMPDVFLLEGASTKNFAEWGVIAPINDILEADPEFYGQFLEGVFDDMKIGDDIYAVPYQMTPCTLLFYNEKLLNEVGVTEPPKDWPAFIDAINKLKAAGKNPIALGNKEQWPAVSPMFSIMADKATGSDFVQKLYAGEAKFTDPEFILALEKVAELRDMGAFNEDMNTLDSEQGRVLFAQGNSGFLFEGGWAVPSIDIAASDELRPYLKVMDTPVMPDGKGSAMTVAGGGGFGFTLNPKLTGAKRDAAIKAIKYFTTGDYVKYLYECGGAPATTVTGADESALSDLTIAVNNYVSQCTFVPVYDVAFPSEIYMLFYAGIQEILTNTTTPQELAQSVQAAFDEYNG